MEQKVLQTKDGELTYEMQGEDITVLQYQGNAIEIEIPSEIEGKKVTSIGKKAFLSNKRIRKIILPETIEEVGDWAFTYCDQLRKIRFPKKDIKIGKDIFGGDKHLQSIEFPKEDMKQLPEGVAYMLTAAVTLLGACSLLNFEEVGTELWLAQWDEKLLQMMKMDDFDGYAELSICGEEDYEGKDYDEISYPSRKRKGKVRMAFFRLLHDQGLQPDKRQFLEQYLKEHTKGTVFSETWDVLKQEKSEDIDYFNIFVNAGCITEKNIDKMIKDLGEEQVQLRAAIMNYKNEVIGYQDQFDEFTL